MDNTEKVNKLRDIYSKFSPAATRSMTDKIERVDEWVGEFLLLPEEAQIVAVGYAFQTPGLGAAMGDNARFQEWAVKHQDVFPVGHKPYW